MGKALYRKYRSKSLDEVVGQEHITDTLKNAIKLNKLSHAYLFTGPKGVGKTSIARILAHAINEIPYDDESVHLDIIEIDAASNRRIDEIRELRDKVHIAPTSARYKVYIIDEVHMLTREAFNALLKTLEEPPEHVIFILATTEAHKVPETIVSRTQRFAFKPIEREAAKRHLRAIAKKEKINIDDAALELIAEHGRGSFRDSISILDQLAGFATQKLTTNEVRLLLGIPDEAVISMCLAALEHNDVAGVFQTVETLRVQGIDSGRAARAISERLRQLLIEGGSSSHYDHIALLKALLALTTTTNDYIGLELALLESFQHKPNVQDDSVKLKKDDSQPQSSKNVLVIPPEPSQEVSATSETENKETTTQQGKNEPDQEITDQIKTVATSGEPAVAKLLPLNSETWNELLQALKAKHNTLYGVLRMASARQEENDIILEFSFGFHKKQIESPKNATIVREYIQQHFGMPQFKCVVVKKDATPSEPTPSPKQKPDVQAHIASLSNIFGGAELLES